MSAPANTSEIARLELRFARSTLRTHVYEADADAPVRNVYVKKAAFDGAEPPAAIVITVMRA